MNKTSSIQQSHHCNLCDHQKTNLKKGSICGLTDLKPTFQKNCPKIQLTQKFEEKVKEANVAYQYALKDKWWTYTYTVVFILASVLVFYLLIKFHERLSEMFEASSTTRGQGFLVVVYIFIATAGVMLFAMAIRAFNSFRQKVNTAARKKEKIDDVLSLYNIKYTVEVSFGKKYHGTQEVSVDFQRKLF
ncbi:hypothetical protein G5B37_10690 [Rasiella rasia]|uniref:Uncharacterized protein n=1 Tax=Rasiella rasia TaxID=2744027 RepID=A0A6G6GNM1_9FLAO|nr:hypothetical protein [Rasiella rasia]QIE60013.1 hypothetical protein G5B37_10690 [Rasiella rasia]